MDVPKAVLDAYIALKAQYTFYIALERINGNFYVYRHKSIYNKETKKQTTESEYLGRITEEGAVIKKSASKEEKRLAIAKALIESYGGKIAWPEVSKEVEVPTPSEVDNKILTILSGDARDSISNISKTVGLSESATSNRIRNLEERYGIKYTIDATLEQFHHHQFIAIAKFIDDKPDFIGLKRVLEEDPRVRLALSTQGAYDLFIFMFAQGPLDAEKIVYKLRSNELLANHKANWNVTYHSQAHGFIPFRDKFFDLVKDKVWKREKGSSKKFPGQFFFREYATMRELNRNSRLPFGQIDKEHHLKEGSAHYTYSALLESGSIRNSTITMERPPIKGTAVFLLEQIDIGEFNKHRQDYFKYLLSDTGVLNKFIFVGDIGSPYGSLFIAPLYKNGDLEHLERDLLSASKGTIARTSMVSDTLVGTLGFRKMESKQTHLYTKLKETEETQSEGFIE